jgi:ligand-binding SRPBCC domain-containing protein
MYLKTSQILPITIDQAWEFFTNPKNLDKLTPGDMKFNITSEFLSEKIYPGMIITYTVSPVLRIPVKWMTEITHVKEKEYFVDDQRSGPFKLWNHQHHLREVDGGVEMTDIIYYKVGFGFLGGIIERLIVTKRVKAIFEHRRSVLNRLFNG